MNVIAVCTGKSVMSVSPGCINIRHTAGLRATHPIYKTCCTRTRSHERWSVTNRDTEKPFNKVQMYFSSFHQNNYTLLSVIQSARLRPLALSVCVMSLCLCTLVALLRDSFNRCNNCFPSEGGLEVCES